jgi:cytochrome b6-f complex iron-sulfur subunit
VRRLERAVVVAVAAHSLAVGIVLLFAPAWGLRLGGFEVPSSTFFPRQAGAFHVVVAAGYLLEHLRDRRVTFLITTKSLAVAFLIGQTLAGAPWCVPASAAADAAMALLVLAVHAAAAREGHALRMEPGRRRAMGALSRLLWAAGAVWLGRALGCAAAPPAEGPRPRTVRVPVRRVEAEGRVVVRSAGEPIEVRRTADGWAAASLVCTHFGCTVDWRSARARYECPCHGGAFDEDGRPVAGPPAAALRALPVRREGWDLVVTLG